MESNRFSVKNIFLNNETKNVNECQCNENTQEKKKETNTEKNKNFELAPTEDYKIYKPKPIRPLIDTPFSCSSMFGLPKMHCSDTQLLNVRHNLFDFQPNDNLTSSEKRKRSWSRAVFSNLQRKGLEKQFEVQKYITKPDRKKLAQRLNLSDSQVKVWFQNRRMKERHRRSIGGKTEGTKTNKLEIKTDSDEEIDVLKD